MTTVRSRRIGPWNSEANAAKTTIEVLGESTLDPSGFAFDQIDRVQFSVDDTTGIVTIEPVSDYFKVWIGGVEYTIREAITFQSDKAEGTHLVYFYGKALVAEASDITSILGEPYAFVFIFYWNASTDTATAIGNERHGIQMDGATHKNLHLTRGAQYYSGHNVSDISVDGDGSDNTHAQIGMSQGVIFDEDIRNDSTDSGQVLTLPAQIPMWYMSGATGTWRKDAATGYPVKRFGTGRLAYNSFADPTWGQTEAGNNSFVLAHIFATNDMTEPVISVQGQAEYGNVTAARQGAEDEIVSLVTTGLPVAEFVPLYTIIFQTSGSYSNTVKARVRSTDAGDDTIDWRIQGYVASAGTGTGDVSGATSSTDNAIVRFDGTTGKVLQNSLVTISDDGSMYLGGVFLISKSGIASIDHDGTDLNIGNIVDGGSILFKAEDSLSVETTMCEMSPGEHVDLSYDPNGSPGSENYAFIGDKDGSNNFVGLGLAGDATYIYLASGEVDITSEGETYISAGISVNINATADFSCSAGASVYIAANTLITLFTSPSGVLSDGARITIDNDVVSIFCNNATPAVLQVSSIGVEMKGTVNIGDGVATGLTIAYNSDDIEITNTDPDGLIKLLARNTGDTATNVLFSGDPDGAAELYYAGSKTFETTLAGATVTGTMLLTGSTITLNSGGTPASAYLRNDTNGDFYIQVGGQLGYLYTYNGACALYHANSKKFETLTTGTLTTGRMQSTLGTLLTPADLADITAQGDVVSATVDTNATGIGAALYMAADGNFDECDADAVATMPCRALALETGTGTKLVLLNGFIRNDAWNWTIGGHIYVDVTTGALTQTAPSGSGDVVQIVGFAWTADIIYFSPGDYSTVEIA